MSSISKFICTILKRKKPFPIFLPCETIISRSLPTLHKPCLLVRRPRPTSINNLEGSREILHPQKPHILDTAVDGNLGYSSKYGLNTIYIYCDESSRLEVTN